jgi:hypothetical protein
MNQNVIFEKKIEGGKTEIISVGVTILLTECKNNIK